MLPFTYPQNSPFLKLYLEINGFVDATVWRSADGKSWEVMESTKIPHIGVPLRTGIRTELEALALRDKYRAHCFPESWSN